MHQTRLCQRAAEREIRSSIEKLLPTSRDIANAQPIEIRIDVAAKVQEETRGFSTLVEKQDLRTLLQKYHARETPALSEIATNLGFQHRSHYEGAVCKLLVDDSDALNFVRSLFGSLHREIEAPT